MRLERWIFAGALAGCLLFPWACKSEDPSTGSSPTITPPTIQQPAPGSTVDIPNPTLRVGNAAGAEGLRYRFEVATDSSFANVVAAAGDLPEGSGGTTSWEVAPSLTTGESYYWRARGSADGADGPFSTVASFEVLGGFQSTTPIDSVLVFDPLTNGTSVGEVGGGEFRKQGWMATNARSYIRYAIPTTPNGFVEFQVTNLREPNPLSKKRNLMIMWDPSKGDYTTNPFRVHLAKYDRRLVDRGHLRLRFISQGQERNAKLDFFDWRRNQVYTFRLEWGAFPDIVSSQRARVLMDGREILNRNYDLIYRPKPHWVELGMAPRAESLEQAIYSNVTIGVRRPSSP